MKRVTVTVGPFGPTDTAIPGALRQLSLLRLARLGLETLVFFLQHLDEAVGDLRRDRGARRMAARGAHPGVADRSRAQARLDASFAALSDATRRGVLEQLGRGDASITDLAEKFHMTLTGMKKHVGVLEQAGLVTTEKVGRVRTCKLGLRRLEEETAWIERYRQLWASRFDELDEVVEELKRKEKIDGRKKRK